MVDDDEYFEVFKDFAISLLCIWFAPSLPQHFWVVERITPVLTS